MPISLNIIVPALGLLSAWIWFLFPILRDEQTAMGTYVILYFLVAPVSIAWGGAYSLEKKLWPWLAVFILLGLIPELIFVFSDV